MIRGWFGIQPRPSHPETYMNPFLVPTIARRGSSMPWRKIRSAQSPAGAHGVRRPWRQALGVMLVTAALGFASTDARAVDVNQASAQQLETIRGIGPRTAEIIINERERGGRFDSFEDLADRVRGIGEKKAQALKAAGLQVGEGDAPAATGQGAAGAATTAKPAKGKPGAPPAAARP
ncbi:MAG: DUF655 domain-containing protein [Achromobacter sp.]|nr:DUF655 domain-containing protein [Achromobacter sp.]